ncbi:uncharacterized protein LOC114525533 [Dendronephthya gigantea]|uniref:uncharacterized protein LOC114525533 n=1 Tax=Dendronephthya gigantea TaxID=151771 RepID=UPI00106B3308|nr:uncharacterized protein LOC114525533 [Dendronephthya gigantea]
MARNSRTEFLAKEMRPLSGVPDVAENEPQTQRAGKKVCTLRPFRTTLERVMAFAILILLLVCVTVVVLYATKDGKDATTTEDEIATACSFSKEALRVGLEEFLRKVQDTYYEYRTVEWIPGMTIRDHIRNIKERYKPMNFTPEYLKEKTDATLALLEEINNMDIDEEKLKSREAKVVYQVKQFLQTTFASPYDANFYSGDWMLGVNHFCFQPICQLGQELGNHARWVRPKNLDDLENILDMIYLHGEAVKQYQSNVQLGVKTGMVRSAFNCKAGLDAFKARYKEITKENDPKGILDESFVVGFRHGLYIKDLSDEDHEEWMKMKGKSISASIDEALVEGLGKPLTDFVEYLGKKHIRNCLPQDLSSGLAGIPVDHIYIDGAPTIIPTTKILPITGQNLSGKENYKSILTSFTTSDISPEEIYEIGKESLRKLFPKAIEIARNVTGQSDNETAIREFRKLLNSSEQFFNDGPFPANESDLAAFKNCSDIESAEKNCPIRWQAMQKWASYGRQTAGMLAPKLIPLFYHTGNKITIPNCPIEFRPNFNPSFGAQSYSHSDTGCTEPAYINIPFFLDNFGPKFSDWSIIAHEGWPGHHTQLQGSLEYFNDPCEDVLKWLDKKSRYSYFTEGWALYAETPLVSENTDTYHGHPLEEYGMLQWEIWRTLRLIVDTGLHYRGMTRTEAIELFSKYAWDDSDFTHKEVTRYQGGPGQATAYKLGQQKIVEMREYCERKLEAKFNLQDFHYQILSIGSAPESYIDKHIKKYVKCLDDEEESDEDECNEILYPMHKAKTSVYAEGGYEQFTRPSSFNYV